jgi:hypothetical protein
MQDGSRYAARLSLAFSPPEIQDSFGFPWGQAESAREQLGECRFEVHELPFASHQQNAGRARNPDARRLRVQSCEAIIENQKVGRKLARQCQAFNFAATYCDGAGRERPGIRDRVPKDPWGTGHFGFPGTTLAPDNDFFVDSVGNMNLAEELP